MLELARRKGFEPLTPRFEVWCSIQLNYRRKVWRENNECGKNNSRYSGVTGRRKWRSLAD